MLAPLDLFLAMSKTNLDDAFESRRIMEIEIERKAAIKATRADIHDLNGMIAAHAKIQSDTVGFRILDSRFHEKLSAIAGKLSSNVSPTASTTWASISADARRRSLADGAKHAGSHSDRRRDCRTGAGSRAAAMTRHIGHIEESTKRRMASETAEISEIELKAQLRAIAKAQ